MGFPEDSQVDVRQVDDENWLLLRTLSYQGQREPFEVPVDAGTDFASVPRAFVWFLPRYGRYTKAAILHDYLWRERAAKGLMTYIDADGTFRRALRELGVPFLRRWILWAAVRLGAVVKEGGTKHWWRESWRVFLVALMALPVVLPPAILIVAALVIFYVFELIAWAALEIVAAIQSSLLRRTDVKEVNLPHLRWKL
jgi:Protein of unknown function (DUF1353)